MIKKVIIPNKQGKPLVALLERPRRKGVFPTVIIQHGFKGSKDQDHIVKTSKDLVKAGFQTIRPDLTNDPGESYLPFSQVTATQEISDFNSVVDYTLNLSTTDKNRLALVGFSLGGLIVTESASINQSIKAIVSAAGVFDPFQIMFSLFSPSELKTAKSKGFLSIYSHTLKKDLKVNYQYLADAKKYQDRSNLKNISCPVLLLHGSKDETVSLSHSKQYKNVIKNSQLKIIKNADHNFSSNQTIMNTMSSEVTKFLSKTLSKLSLSSS